MSFQIRVGVIVARLAINWYNNISLLAPEFVFICDNLCCNCGFFYKYKRYGSLIGTSAEILNSLF